AAADRCRADAGFPGIGAVGAGGRRCRQDRDAGLHHAVLGGGRVLGGAAATALARPARGGGDRAGRAGLDAGTLAGARHPAQHLPRGLRGIVLGDRHGAEQAGLHARAGQRAVAERVAARGRFGRAGGGGTAGGRAAGAVDARVHRCGALQRRARLGAGVAAVDHHRGPAAGHRRRAVQPGGAGHGRALRLGAAGRGAVARGMGRDRPDGPGAGRGGALPQRGMTSPRGPAVASRHRRVPGPSEGDVMKSEVCMLRAALACLLLFPLVAPAQDEAAVAAWEAAATPGAEHAQLAEHFVGTWDTKMTLWMDPVTPPLVETGRAVASTELGGRHVRMDFHGNFMGAPFEGTGSTGYDNVRRQYVSTWKDNMSTAVMFSYGDYDAATSTYTFRSEAPDPLDAG